MKKTAITLITYLCALSSLLAQSIYEEGDFGEFYGATLVETDAATRYNDVVKFKATHYFPFLPEEYDPSGPKKPADVCTRAIVLYTPKSEQEGIYSPVEVIAGDDGDKIIYPFIDLVGVGQMPAGYHAKFEDFPYIDFSTPHPYESKDAVAVMEAAQKFNQWTYQMFGWKGFDMDGTVPIVFIVEETVNTGFSPGEQYIKINTYNSPPFKYSQACRDVVGHEITHGILDFAVGHTPGSNEYSEMEEGFASIMGLGFYNSQKTPFDPIGHYPSYLDVKVAKTNFRFPKFGNNPSTYKGTYYKMPGDKGYSLHHNGYVLTHCFFIMANGQMGFIDEDAAKGNYNVLPLDMIDKKKSWDIGLKLFFKTFTEKLTTKSNFIDAREQMLEIAIDMGYPVGSHVYIQVANAWNAIGVGEKWNPVQYNASCIDGKERIAESLYYGPVKINTLRATSTKKPHSAPIYLLEDCLQNPAIKTNPYISPATISYEDVVKEENGPPVIFEIKAQDYNKTLAADLNNNGVYTLDDNVKSSKSLVSVHWGSKQASSYFQSKYGYSGIDGIGMLPIQNRVTEESASMTGFDAQEKVFYYRMGDGKLDQISKTYFQAIYHFVLGHKESQTGGSETEGIKLALGNIFALGIKNQYEKDLSYPLSWEIDDEKSKWIFSNPKDAGQATYYQQGSYDPNNPENISGIVNYWYQLLVNGTWSPYAVGWQNEVGEHDEILGIGQELAEKIVFLALTRYLPPNATFGQMRSATQLAVTEGLGYAHNSPAYMAVTDAWNAVGVGLNSVPMKTSRELAYGAEQKVCQTFGDR